MLTWAVDAESLTSEIAEILHVFNVIKRGVGIALEQLYGLGAELFRHVGVVPKRMGRPCQSAGCCLVSYTGVSAVQP
jgi:hypothetical protein